MLMSGKSNCFEGTPGARGDKGDLGPTGPPGMPGEKGARGKRGKRVSLRLTNWFLTMNCAWERRQLERQMLHDAFLQCI